MEREKTCPQCQALFICSTEKCWCSLLPNIVALHEKAECLCPNCLTAVIEEKTKNHGNTTK